MKKTTFAALAAACLLSFTLGFAVTAAETPARRKNSRRCILFM